ncbi:MAG: PAS domain-containing protein [Comamonadaceae bacterium]|nr:PAS domain-containing protein [Comamonadaceae bacterium]
MEDLLACEPGALTDQGQLFAHPTDQLLAASLAEHYDEIASRGACEFELHMFRRKGDPIWVAVQGRAVNPERPELGYIFAFVNVDERKRSERELRTALGELQLIFDNALVGMAYVADELLIKANAATERMFGYGAGDLSELEIASLFADRADWRSIRAEAAGGEAEFERLMRRADGSTLLVRGQRAPARSAAARARPDPGADGRRHAAPLRKTNCKRVRNYLDLVVENLPVLVSRARRRHRPLRQPQPRRRADHRRWRATQVLGRTWHEIYGRQFADLYAELDRARAGHRPAGRAAARRRCCAPTAAR